VEVNVPQVIMNKKNNPDPFSLVPIYGKWKSNDGGRTGGGLVVETICKSLILWQRTRTDSMVSTRFCWKKMCSLARA
jgi:hypothetical protein